MKHTDEEIEIIAKSMYKAVKKALYSGLTSETSKKANRKEKKDVISDLMDSNYIAEAKESVPPRRISNMNKTSEKGIDKLKKFVKKARKQ